MVKNQNKFYLYDRWFQYQKQNEEKYIYISTPKNETSYAIIEINKNTNEMFVYYYENNKLIERFETSDINQSSIDIHYIQEVCYIMEIEKHRYNNISIELFTNINNDDVPHDYQIKFLKQNKKSKENYAKIPFPFDEKINMEELQFSSKSVDKFIDFASTLHIYVKKIRNVISLQDNQKIKKDLPTLKELVIPQSLEVYDRVYYLNKITERKIILSNTEDGIRNLEINFNPEKFSLSCINLKIKGNFDKEAVIKITKNKQDEIVAKYESGIEEKIKAGETIYENVKMNSVMNFDSNNKKTENKIIISSEENKVELLEHPSIKNRYTDGCGNMISVNNSGYYIFYGIASYAPIIFNSIEKKLFKIKQ